MACINLTGITDISEPDDEDPFSTSKSVPPDIDAEELAVDHGPTVLQAHTQLARMPRKYPWSPCDLNGLICVHCRDKAGMQCLDTC